MKRIKSFFLLSVFFLFTAVKAESAPSVSFSFEKSCAPDGPVKMLRSGKAVPLQASFGSKVIDKKKILTGGLAGKGLHIGSREGKGHDTISFYRREGLAFAGKGSISFWVRPDDWDIRHRKNVGYVRLTSPSGESLAVVSQFFAGRSRVIAYYGLVNKPGISTVRTSPGKWQKGIWQHVAVTWGGGEFSIYLNGKFAGTAKIKPAAEDFCHLSLGGVWGHTSPGSSTLDDVRFFDRKLSSGEVKEEYARLSGLAATSRCVELQLGRRTPVLDGRITEGEYAAGFAFMRLRGKNMDPVLSDRQTMVYLSGDEKNLYWAAVTSGKNLRTDIRGRDNNVWEDDAVELYITAGEKAKMHHFIVNSTGAVYDAVVEKGAENKKWNSRGLELKSRVKDGVWICEAAVPWKELELSYGNGKSFYFNACRTYIGLRSVDKNYTYDRAAASAVNTSISPGEFQNRIFFARAVINSGAPAFVYTPLESVYKQKIDAGAAVFADSDDTVTLSASVSGKPRFGVLQTQKVRAGQKAGFSMKGEVPREGELETTLESRKAGVIFAAKIPYFKTSPLLYHSMFTRLPAPELVFVTECRDDGGSKCTISLRMTEWSSGKEVFRAQRSLTTIRGTNQTVFDISKLPEGIFKVSYELKDASGKAFAKDTEYYANYTGDPQWHKTQVGLGDIVPVPWTPPEFGKTGFKCWGRSHTFGGGVLSSLKSGGRELLARPVQLILNGKSVKFTARLLKAGKSYGDYLLTPADRKLPLEIRVRAEFDGYMWFDLIMDGKGFKIDSLRLDVPMDRKYAFAIDDNSSANVKHDISSWKNRSYAVDPVINPFYWIGGADSGIMGGVDNCRGWYFKNKARGLVYTVTPEEVGTTLNFVDTPFVLNGRRTIGFYLQGTPVKPKNAAAAALRDRKSMWFWSGYINDFYEHKWPDMMYKARYNLMYGIQKRGARVFWYNSSKGASPVSPWWNRYGIDWNVAGNPGKMQQDMTVATRELRDRNLWAWTCLNSRSYMEYKLHCINWFLNSKEFDARDLYFDLAWPRACSNSHHGCLRRDEFGHVQRSFDMRTLREFHKRIYIAMKQKDPTALMLGHETFYRVPSDNFFDLLIGGETYERQIAQTHNYYDIFTPEIMRILNGLRTNETTILMVCQIVRTMQMYSPKLYRKLAAVSPNILEKEHRHYLAYLAVHNISAAIFSGKHDLLTSRLADACESLGEQRKFHSYWDLRSGIKPVRAHKRFLYSSFSAPGKLLVVLLNDTDQKMSNGVVIDPRLVPVLSAEGKEVLSGEKFRLNSNRLEVELPPRAARFIFFSR